MVCGVCSLQALHPSRQGGVFFGNYTGGTSSWQGACSPSGAAGSSTGNSWEGSVHQEWRLSFLSLGLSMFLGQSRVSRAEGTPCGILPAPFCPAFLLSQSTEQLMAHKERSEPQQAETGEMKQRHWDTDKTAMTS